MKKIFILIAVSLFVVGAFFFLGSYFIFNRYSISDSHFFDGYAWQLPQVPLELHEGDRVEIKISQTDSLNGSISMVNSTGQKRALVSSSLSNGTVDYYVRTSDSYRFFIEFDSWGPYPPYVLALDITVVDKDPNLWFQLLGGIVLLADAVMMAHAYVSARQEENNRPLTSTQAPSARACLQDISIENILQ